MVKEEFLSYGQSLVTAAGLARVEYIPYFPSPLLSEIGSSASKISKMKKATLQVQNFESQQSAMNAALGSTIMGKRTLLPISSPLSLEDFYNAAFLRIPL